jgi:hypothetical protein
MSLRATISTRDVFGATSSRFTAPTSRCVSSVYRNPPGSMSAESRVAPVSCNAFSSRMYARPRTTGVQSASPSTPVSAAASAASVAPNLAPARTTRVQPESSRSVSVATRIDCSHAARRFGSSSLPAESPVPS